MMLHSLRSGYLREDEDDDDERSTETMTTEKIRRGRGIGGKGKLSKNVWVNRFFSSSGTTRPMTIRARHRSTYTRE